jgi:hypothetical protein
VDWVPGFGVPGNGFDAMVRALVVYDDGTGPALYAAGDFTHAGGVPALGIAKWDGTTWSEVGGGLANSVLALEVFDDGSGSALYAGGYLYTAGGSPVNYIAKWDGSSWSDVGGGVDSPVESFAVHDDGSGPALYVGGAFDNAGGSPALNIARWDGGAWSSVGAGLTTDVLCLKSFDDGSGPALYAGCPSPNMLRRWDGSTWSLVGSGLAGGAGYVASLAVFGGNLCAGGNFDFANGGANHANNVARWDGSLWHALGNHTNGGGTNSSVMALAAFDDGTGPALFAGGGFSTADTFAAEKMAKWNGSSWAPLGTGIMGTRPYSMAAFDGGTGSRLYVGGEFSTAGDLPSKHIAAWGIPCSPPQIILQPVSQTAVFDQPVIFSVQSIGTAPLTYEWRKDGVAVQNVFERIEGATTPTLTLFYWSYSDSGSYTCRVRNSFGTVFSDAAVLTVPAGGDSGAPIELQRIILPPEPVPNVPGATYTRFTSPIESSSGDVAFEAAITGLPLGTRSINLWSNGSTEMLYQDYDQAPGTPTGVQFGGGSANAFLTYLVGANGDVAFTSQLSGPGVNGTNSAGLWYRDASGGDLVARMGDSVPSVPGTTVRQIYNPVGLSDAARVAYAATLNLSGSFFAKGIWTWERASGQVLVALTGQSAPGTTGNFIAVEESALVTNHGGALAFVAQVTGGDWGVWTGGPGSLQLVVRSGDPVPGAPSGSTFQTFNYPVLNEGGDVAFQSFVQLPGGATQRDAFRWSSGTIVPIALEDDPAPDAPGQTFAVPKPIAMNDAGDVLFYSYLHDGTCTGNCHQYGYFLSDSIGLTSIVMNHADPLPEAPPDFVLAGLGPAIINGSGQVVVSVDLSYGSRFGATYGWTRDHGLFPIAVPGSQIEVGPGDFRTVMNAWISRTLGGTSGEESGSTSLTEGGRTILNLGFTDQTLGIYSGQFTGFEALYFPPGTPFCAGDGSLPTPCPCGNTGFLGRGCQNSASTGGASLTSAGGASLAEDRVILTSTGERPTSLSIFLQGTTNLAGGVNYGDGVRCVGGILKRIAARNAIAGTVTYPLAGDPSISARSATLGNPIAPGSTRYYQTYYRDPAPGFCPTPPGNTFNVSSGQIIQWFP